LGALSKGTASLGRGSIGSGAVTAVATAVTTGTAALAGVVLARKFGRDAETDGFLFAYTVYLVLVLAATSFRVVALPPLAGAAAARRLGGEAAGFAAAFAALGLPLVLLGLFASDRLAGLALADDRAASAAADAFVWLVPAAVLQLYASLAASALAARDSYGVAALGYSLGGSLGLAAFLLLAGAHGIVALAWGTLLNAAVCLAVPLLALVVRRQLDGLREAPLALAARLRAFLDGAALPLALQALVVVALALADALGEGAVTSFTYAFLLASALVATTASSLSLVSSVPLTRSGLEHGRAAAHVVSTTWLSLVVVAAAAGVFALVGGSVVHAVLGDAYSSEAGAELGRVVVYLSAWMVASVAVSVTFPLLFVAGSTRRLPALAVGALAAHVPIAWAGRELGGLEGLALALAATTALVLAALLALLAPATLREAGRGIAAAALATGALAAVAFGGLALVLDPWPAAAGGLVLYAAALRLLRPRGLRAAVSYVRALA
jgi:hypothetical protein